jgi:RNA polymerase sigma-70 factor (ECF subfamily)
MKERPFDADAFASRIARSPSETTEALLRVFHDARAAMPRIALEFEVFARHLADKFPDGASLEDWLAGVNEQELYLACACAQGNASAIAHCEATHLSKLVPTLARFAKNAGDLEDLKQLTRTRLFLSDGEHRPKIAEYAGSGSLEGWMRVVATRVALNFGRNMDETEAKAGERELMALASPAFGPEAAYMKSHYRHELRAALSEAVSSLSTRDRNVLKQHYCDGLTLIEVGAAYQVHRVTAARWVDEARARLLSATRLAFARRARVSEGELESILRLLESDLALTLRDFFTPEM